MSSSVSTHYSRPRDASSDSEHRDGTSSARVSSSSHYKSKSWSPSRRHSSHSRGHSPRSSSAPPAWLLEKVVLLEIRNRELERQLGIQRRDYHHEESSRPTSSSRAREMEYDVKPNVPPASRKKHIPTQDDEDFPLGITVEKADQQALLYWDVLNTSPEFPRSRGFPPDVWEKMLAAPEYSNVAFKFVPLAPHCLRPDGVSMVGGNKRCPAFQILHAIAGGIIDVLYVKGPLPQQQPHLDLMGLMCEHLIDAARNSVPGERKTRALANKHAPSTYVRPGALAVSMVAHYITLHKEKHRKARKTRIGIAAAMEEHGERPPRKSAPKVEKHNAAYEKLRGQSHAGDSDSTTPSAFANLPNKLPQFRRQGLPPSPQLQRSHPAPDRTCACKAGEALCEECRPRHGTPRARESTETVDIADAVGSPSPRSRAQKQVSPHKPVGMTSPASMASRKLPAIAPAPILKRAVDRVESVTDLALELDFDENVQDFFAVSTTGGVAIACSPPKASKGKKGKAAKEEAKVEEPAVVRPPNHSPSARRTKALTKKEKKQAATEKAAHTRQVNAQAKLKATSGAKAKSKAAQESEASSEEENLQNGAAHGRAPDAGDVTDRDSGDESDFNPPPRGYAAPPPPHGKNGVKKSTASTLAKPSGAKLSGKNPPKTAAPAPTNKMKRHRTDEHLETSTDTRRSKRNSGAAGEGTGEFDDAYWLGVEKDQSKVDAWCVRLGIDQWEALRLPAGQGLTTAPLRREYLAGLCAVEQAIQEIELDPRWDKPERSEKN
ncbi:hypothetical protein P7C70_g1630, partial [Phenoliferia sp. Uapishka_3]